MREKEGDLFVVGRSCNALCLTTNGTVKNNGRAVMGRGVAQHARDNWPGTDRRLGHALRLNGNIVQKIGTRRDYSRRYAIVAYPVKHGWHEDADLDLIMQSAQQLVELADQEGWRTIALPRPGCGNGQQSWSVVKPLIEPILDDRFVVVNNEGGANVSAQVIVCRR